MRTSVFLLFCGSFLLVNAHEDLITDEDVYKDLLAEMKNREIPEMNIPDLIKYWGETQNNLTTLKA